MTLWRVSTARSGSMSIGLYTSGVSIAVRMRPALAGLAWECPAAQGKALDAAEAEAVEPWLRDRHARVGAAVLGAELGRGLVRHLMASELMTLKVARAGVRFHWRAGLFTAARLSPEPPRPAARMPAVPPCPAVAAPIRPDQQAKGRASRAQTPPWPRPSKNA